MTNNTRNIFDCVKNNNLMHLLALNSSWCTSCNHTMVFHTLVMTVTSASFLINTSSKRSGWLLEAAKCNAVQPNCINKTKSNTLMIQTIQSHYTDDC